MQLQKKFARNMADWHRLGKKQYERHLAYDLHFDASNIKFKYYNIRCAPFSGPICMISKEMSTKTLHIYLSNGKLVANVALAENVSNLIHFDWTPEMRLVCIFENGNAVSYNIFGERVVQFDLLPPKSKDHITQSICYPGGLVSISKDKLLIHVAEVDTVRPKISLMADIKELLSSKHRISCLCLLEPRFAKGSGPQVFLATDGGDLYVATKTDVVDLKVRDSLTKNGIITNMAIAPNGMFMGVFTSDGFLTVLNTSFDNKILSFDTGGDESHVSPHQMVWCGEDAIVLHWRDSTDKQLVVVGPFGEYLTFSYASADGFDGQFADLVLCQEIDCCRIYTANKHHVLRRVASKVEKIQQIGSTSPGSMLLEALIAYDDGNAKADENIRFLQTEHQLSEACEEALEAAIEQFDTNMQRKLLRAASYGRLFLLQTTTGADGDDPSGEDDDDLDLDFDPEIFVECCRTIRVLNALRTIKVGMPLTRLQYERLTPQVVIGRLVTQRLYYLALQLCKYLKISPDRVLVHWACEKVKSSLELTDEQVVSLVRKKLHFAKRVSYAEIASCAEKVNRRQLATLLLNFEESPNDQVPLLLSMGEFEIGLKKAIQSADTNLIYMALLHMERVLKSSDEIKALLTRDDFYREALDLMISFYRQTKCINSKIVALWTDSNGQDTMESSGHAVHLAYKSSSWESYIERLNDAGKKYSQAKSSVHAKATEDQVELVQEQLKYQNKLSAKIVGTSVCDTIQIFCMASRKDPKLLVHANAFAKKFKVPDKCFYRVKIRALVRTRQWDALHKFSNEKKNPPCGFKPFALACYNADKKTLADEYAARISSLEEVFECLIYMESWHKALDLAVKQRDPEKLSTIRNQCTDTDIHNLVDKSAVQLGFVS